MTIFSWLLRAGLLAFAFALGVALGAVGMYRAVQRHVAERLDSQTWAPRTLDWLDRELALNDSQRAACEPIVQSAVQELVRLRQDAEAERKGILAKMFLELRETLPAEQRTKLEEAVRRRTAAGNSVGKSAGKPSSQAPGQDFGP